MSLFRLSIGILCTLIILMIEVPPDRVLPPIAAWFRDAGWLSVAEWLGNPQTDHFLRHYFVWIPVVIALLSLYSIFDALVRLSFAKLSRRTKPASQSAEAHHGRSGARFRILRKIKIWLFIARRRIARHWQLTGPFDYSVASSRPDFTGRNYPCLSNDRVAFSGRFADAFPGTRDLLTISDPDLIIRRLNVLLRWPVEVVVLRQGIEVGSATPFYWNSGDGNMHIHRYFHYKRRMILLNEMEIRPAFLAAVGGDVYWSTYVYLEAAALPARNIHGEENVGLGSHQEFAIYKGAVFNRREYDDGSYLKNHVPIRFSVHPDLRSRNLEPFGFLLIPNSSPANNPRRDEEIEHHIRNVIQDKGAIREFADYLLALPKERQR